MVERGFGDHTALIGNGRRRTYKELTDWSNRARPRAGRGLRRQARQPRADPLRQQPGDGRGLARRDQGRRASSSTPCRCCAPANWRRSSTRPRSRWRCATAASTDEIVACAKDSRFLKQVDRLRRHLQPRRRARPHRARQAGALRRGEDRPRRRRAARLHLRHHRRAEGDDALPSRSADHRRRLRAAKCSASRPTTCSSARRRSPSPSGSAGSRSFRCASARRRRCSRTPRPPNMIEIIETYKATICFTAPTAYRAMLAAMDKGADLSSLRIACRPARRCRRRCSRTGRSKTGKPILDGIGATEMLHIFITNRIGDAAPGATGTAGRRLRGARSSTTTCNEVPRGTVGRLAVRGPTGCRYLADERQTDYVRDGWNLTGDTFMQDADGYFQFAARTDDMIISAGYNIAGPEVEAALLSHRRGRGMRGDRRARRGARPDRRGARRAASRASPATRRCVEAAAGSRQGDDRALQISALGQVHRRAAEDADRQDPALPAARAAAKRVAHSTMEARASRSDRMTRARMNSAAAGWAAPKGYANGIAATGRQVFVAGQIGWNGAVPVRERRFRRPGRAGAAQHRRGAGRGAAPGRSTSCG